MNKAKSVGSVTVIDPDTKGEVELSVFKDLGSGGMFAVDTSWLISVPEDEEDIIIDSPFNDEKLLLVELDGETTI